MIAVAGVAYLIVIAFAGRAFGADGPGKSVMTPDDRLPCQLILGLALFFFVFDVFGAVELFAPGKWVTLPRAATLAVVIVAIGFAWNRWRSGAAPAKRGAAPPHTVAAPLTFITKVVLIALLGGFAFLALLLCIGFPRGYEVNAYHLPIAVNIFRDGSLRVWDKAFVHTFPANMSVWAGFWLQLLPERLTSVVNLPFLGVCVLFLYRLCRLAGADRSASWLVAGGLTTIPVFGFSSLELGADVAGVACALAATWCVLARPRCMLGWPVLG